MAATGLEFGLSSREERSDLVAVARLLLELGALSRVAGDEQTFVITPAMCSTTSSTVTSSVLLTVRGPSMMQSEEFEDRLAEVTAELPAASDDQRNRAMRFRLTRILLDEPVLYYDTLNESELAYLTRQRSAICGRINEFTGLVAEIRAEGIAMVDPFDDLTDVRMPEVGTDGHVTLLVAEWLVTPNRCSGAADRVAAGRGPRRAPSTCGGASGSGSRVSKAPRSNSSRLR